MSFTSHKFHVRDVYSSRFSQYFSFTDQHQKRLRTKVHNYNFEAYLSKNFDFLQSFDAPMLLNYFITTFVLFISEKKK